MTQRTLLITGSSSGIGHHAAHAFRARGWRVFATCRAEADCARLRDEGLESVRLDYTDPDSIGSAMDHVLGQTGGRLDGLFNNGAYAIPGACEDLPTDAFRAIFEANFFGWHELTRQVIPVMRAQGSGRIVQCSSVLGFTALRYRAPYISTKWALEGYSDCLRYELQGSGVRIILIEPGPIGTKIRINAQPHYRRWITPEGSAHEQVYRDQLEPRLFAPPGQDKDAFELTCAATTKKLIRAFESPRPKTRYFVTTPTYAVHWMKRLLPWSWVDTLMMRN